MLVSMMAILSIVSCLPMSVHADNFTYLAYVPNPPMLTPVTWNDDPPLVYINDSSWYPAPEDQRDPKFPDEEGREFILYGHTDLGYLYTPICIGPIPPCLPLVDQAWVLPKRKGKDTYRELFMLSGKGLQTQELYTHSFPPSLHPCQDNWVDAHFRIHWEECRGSLDRVLFNNSHGTVVDWGPYGIAVCVYSRSKCSDPQSLREQIQE